MTDLLKHAPQLLAATLQRLVCGVRLLGGHGFHFGAFHRNGRGFALGGRLFEIGLAALVCFSLATISHLAVADWVEKRYANPELSRAAGILTFIVVLGALGFGLARSL
jgi:hypothetical protein